MVTISKPLICERLLGYQDECVIRHFAAEENIPLDVAARLFCDLMRFFWLESKRREQGKKTYFFGPLLVLDRLWHCFILHTRAYHHFCQTVFGEYYHHDVEPFGQEHALDQAELEDFLTDCFTLLGEDFVDRHFSALYADPSA